MVRFALLILGVAMVLVLVGPSPVATSQDTDAFQEELTKGRGLLRKSQFEEALKSFKRANEMRGKKCAECLSLMADAYYGLEDYKKVVETADKAIALAGDDKQLVSKVYINKGLALQASAEKKDQKKLQGAEAAFRQAMSFEGAPPVTHYNLGVVLLQMNRDPEGIAEIQQYLKAQPNGYFAETAKKMAGNPRRARENYAPDFSFTSLSGEEVSLDSLQGKVVLLDFWGTWCPPCVASVPELRNLYRRYSKEQFVLIGISSDFDEAKWRDFTGKNRMLWPQYRDTDRRILEAFSIRAFPTYIIIDHEGILRFQSTGFGAANLDAAVKRQIRAANQSVDAR